MNKWLDDCNGINVMSSPAAVNTLEWWRTYVSYPVVELEPRGFPLSLAKMNGHVFIHSGVKLLLYLADWCGLMYSPRFHFLSLCTSLATVSSPYHTWCNAFTVAALAITKDLWGCLWAGMCSNVEARPANCSDGSVQAVVTPQWSCWLIYWFSQMRRWPEAPPTHPIRLIEVAVLIAGLF